MPSFCRTCGRARHAGLCDMIELTDGRTVHANRVDDYTGDVRKQISRGEVKVKNRWIKKKSEPKPKARRT